MVLKGRTTGAVAVTARVRTSGITNDDSAPVSHAGAQPAQSGLRSDDGRGRGDSASRDTAHGHGPFGIRRCRWADGPDHEGVPRLAPVGRLGVAGTDVAARAQSARVRVDGEGLGSGEDGVLQGPQHNTYDVEFYGPNPMCGIYYLGALRACEAMASAVRDDAFARECRALFETGARWIDANLFNGEFYVQQVRGFKREEIADTIVVDMGSDTSEHPEYQVGAGCLLDQLVGQYQSAVCGLGALVDEADVRKTLESIYRYSYKRDLAAH